MRRFDRARPEFPEVNETKEIAQAPGIFPLAPREGADRHYELFRTFPAPPRI